MKPGPDTVASWKHVNSVRDLKTSSSLDAYRNALGGALMQLDDDTRQSFIDGYFGDSLENRDFDDAAFLHGLGATVTESSLAQVSDEYGDRPDIADFFQSAGCDPLNSRTMNGSSGLHRAAANGHLRLIHWFIGNGVPVDIGTDIDQDDGPLYAAVAHKELQSVAVLLEAGADANRRTRVWARTPVELAKEENWVEGQAVLEGGNKKGQVHL